MEALRITLFAWTASFRYPQFVQLQQPTLPLPPLTTVLGLLAAAAGREWIPHDGRIGYHFESDGIGKDLERLWEWERERDGRLHPKIGDNHLPSSNVYLREFHVNAKLTLYLTDTAAARLFAEPYYTLLLGRSSDLAAVTEIKLIELESVPEILLEGSLLPLGVEGAIGPMVALPSRMTFETPRCALGVRPWILHRTSRRPCRGDSLFRDTDADRGVYMHTICDE